MLKILLNQWREALGGLQRLQDLRTVSRYGTVQFAGSEGAFEEAFTSQGQYCQASKLDNGYSMQVVLGGPAGDWMKRGGKATPLAGLERSLTAAIAYMESLAVVTPGRALGGICESGASADGQYDLFEIERPGEPKILAALDRQTHRLAWYKLDFGGLALEYRLEDWREVNGLWLPFRRVEIEQPANNESIIEFNKVIVDEPLDAALFDRPVDDPPPFKFEQPGPLTVPFELTSNKIYFPLQVNGGGPFWFIFDTGAGLSISLDARLADELGVEAFGEYSTGGAGANIVQARLAKDVGLRLGAPGEAGIVFDAQAADIIPLDQILGPTEGRRPFGLFGGGLIKHLVVAIDYPARRLTFHDPAAYTYPGAGQVIPLQLMSDCPVVEATVTLPGRPPAAGMFLVDVGIRSALTLTAPFVKQHELLASPQPFIQATVGWGIGGRVDEQVGRGTLRLGPFEITEMVMGLSEATAGAENSSMLAGIIGDELMRRFDLVLDYPNGRMFLAPNADFAQPYEFDMSGLFLRAEPPDYRRVTVLSVTTGSAAEEAGLRAGDELEGVNGALPPSLEAVRQAALRPGQRLALRVRRSEQVFDIELTTRRQV
jgi:hypothetical protein